MPVPLSTDYAPYYSKYISRVPEPAILPVLRSEFAFTAAFLSAIPPASELILHAPYTWTVRQVVGHMLDTERVFAYRALWFARGETTSLPGFEEGPFSTNAPHSWISLPELVDEFRHLRESTCRLFEQLDEAAWERRGVASLGEITVRALAYCVVGHERHHMGILRSRFGVS